MHLQHRIESECQKEKDASLDYQLLLFFGSIAAP
jgi:hypothetical protein